MSVETPKERLDKVKKAITGTGIAVALLATGSYTSDHLIASVDLNGRRFTPVEYEQLRPKLIRQVKSKRNKGEPITYEEMQLFFATFNRENAKKKYNLVGDKPVVDKILEAMEFREVYEK